MCPCGFMCLVRNCLNGETVMNTKEASSVAGEPSPDLVQFLLLAQERKKLIDEAIADRYNTDAETAIIETCDEQFRRIMEDQSAWRRGGR